MTVVNMVVGAATPGGATFVAKVDGGGPVRVAVADNANMISPVFTGSQAVDAQGVAKVSITGLASDTPHWWRVEDASVLDTATTGQFRTHPLPGVPASFTIAVASCAGSAPQFPGVAGGELAANRISNHPVFDTVRQLDPLFFAHLGDLNYYDLGSGSHGIAGGGSLTNYRAGYDDVLAQPRQGQLYREVPWVYAWDDHDYGPDNSDGTLATKANAAAVYRERAPHYPLDSGTSIYQSFQVGRVLFVLADTRYERTPNADPDGPSKTILGAAQKSWLSDLLATSEAAALVWLTPSQWLGTTSDGWPNFATERAELAELFTSTGWAGRMCQVYGDRHALGISSGPGNTFGGWPILMAASLDSSFADPAPGVYDVLTDTPGRNQYGTIAVTDHGTHIIIKLTAYTGTTPLGSHSFAVDAQTPTSPGGGNLLVSRAVAGSHTALFEARVVTSFQSGEDPDGVEIPVLGGDVQLDATAAIHGTLSVATDGNTLWPRLTTDLLAPYGNEIFVRRGVDLGGDGPLWIPLGYYRIETPDQDNAPFGPIQLSGSDRMAGIVDARFVAPRQLSAGTTLHDVVLDIVGEVYPDAEVVWDDATEFATLARDIVGEESRYELLYDVITSVGKVMRWDGAGRLAIFTAPDPTVPLWVLGAGRAGVLIQASRQLTRLGVYNGVVARGEGADEGDPVQAVAVDIGARSPTRWGGRFGQVPRFYASPLLATEVQALQAAREMLRRNLGLPYSVSLTAVCNPAIRPWDPVRIVQQDGTRDLHLMQTVTIPLDAQTALTGTTQEQTRTLIGSL